MKEIILGKYLAKGQIKLYWKYLVLPKKQNEQLISELVQREFFWKEMKGNIEEIGGHT